MNAQIFLLSKPELLSQHSEFLRSRQLEWLEAECATPAERLVEFAGRICYLSFGAARQSPRTNSAYIAHLIASGHESVLEHAVWSFLLSNVSRAFSHQLVRHRVGFSYSQLSQQYHDESEAEFLLPAGIEEGSEAFVAWQNSIEAARTAYRALLVTSEIGTDASHRENIRARRSAARSVLPNATATTIVITANARAIRHFLKVRGSIQGDIEMRHVSSLIYRCLQPDAPSIFADFVCEVAKDGYELVRQILIEKKATK